MRSGKRILLILAAVWLVAGAVIWLTRSLRPTPESIAAYIKDHPLAEASQTERARVIDHVADQLNRLDFDQRQELRKTSLDRRFFEQMTPEERQRFLEATLPEGFRQLMIALNKMDPEKRRKLVQRALDDIGKDDPRMNDRLDQEAARKMIEQGLDSFYKDASAEVKLDFAPVIEQLQRATQNRR